MKKIPTWLIIVLVIGLLIASKFLFFAKKDQPSPGAPKGKSSAPLAVNYYVTESGEFNNDVFATGKIGAFNQIEIVPEVSGKITGLFFKEGETVNKGQLLIKLNDADLQAQLQKVRTQLKLSNQKLERLKKLLEIKGISQEEFEMQENEFLSLKADETFILAQIAKTNITAPFPGVVGLRNISEGAIVNAATPIASLVQMKPVYVEFSVPQKYDELFKKGGTIRFANEEITTSSTYTGSIYAIDPLVDESTKTIRARAMYNGDHTFFPGSFVKVFVDLGKTTNAIMVPTEAVVATLKGQKVFVSRQNKAVEVPVTIGVRTDKRLQILSGLKVGDTIVTTGLLSVKKDTPLKLVKQDN